nr:Retrovirus-related Pol polyprotein from transposon 297 [Ipomoea batatas]
MTTSSRPASPEGSPVPPSLTEIQDQIDRAAFTNLQYQQRTDSAMQHIVSTMERLERMVSGSATVRPQPPMPGLLGPIPNPPRPTRVRIYAFTMEGKASEWYRWMKRNNLFTTWTKFLRQVELRFGASGLVVFQGKLSKLVHLTSVADYQSEFESLMNRVSGISESILISMFVAGLKSHIRQEVQRAPKGPTPNQPVTPSSVVASPAPGPPQRSLTLPPAATLNQPKEASASLPIRRLTPQEIREKRAKGLCYNCDQRYTANHHCQSKFLLLLGTDDNDDLGDVAAVNVEDATPLMMI